MFPLNISQRLHCLGRRPTIEKPSGGGVNGNNIFSQIQYVVTSSTTSSLAGGTRSLMTTFVFDDTPSPRVVRGGYPTTKSFRNHASSLQANISWNEMLHASSPVLSSTSWSEICPYRRFLRRLLSQLHRVFFSCVEYQFFIVVSRRHQGLVHPVSYTHLTLPTIYSV